MHIRSKVTLRLAALTLPAIVTGCISTDPGPAIEQAGLLAEGRTSTAMTPGEAWSAPFTDRSGIWNGSDPIDQETALRVALRNDPELRRQLALVAERQADLAQSSLPPNPAIGFGVGIATDGMSGAPSMIQLMQQLTWIWTIKDRMDVSDRRLKAMVLDAAGTTVRRTAAVRSSFSRLLHAQELVALHERYATTTATSLDLTGALAEVGELPSLEVDRASIEHRAAEAALASARLEARTRRIELLRAIGWPEHRTEFSAIGTFAGADRATGPSETEVIERAVLVRLDVAAAEQRVLAEEADARLQGWRRLPEVTGMVDFRENASGRTATLPGASVSVPVLDDGSAAIAKASARVEQARLAAAITRENAIEQARRALNRWKQARQQVILFEDGLVSSARDVVTRSELSFKAGVSDATELLLTQRRMIELEVELLAERLTASLAWVELEDAVGGSFDLPLERPDTEGRANS